MASVCFHVMQRGEWKTAYPAIIWNDSMHEKQQKLGRGLMSMQKRVNELQKRGGGGVHSPRRGRAKRRQLPFLLSFLARRKVSPVHAGGAFLVSIIGALQIQPGTFERQ